MAASTRRGRDELQGADPPRGDGRQLVIGGEASLVAADDIPSRLLDIDLEDVRQTQKVLEHVAHLHQHRLAEFRVGHDGTRLIWRQPLEDVEKFTDLPGERHHEVLWSVVLLPVALRCEPGQRLLKVSDAHRRTDPTSSIEPFSIRLMMKSLVWSSSK